MRALFEPGFFASTPVRTALVVGAIVALASGVIGVLTVIRSQSFSGHALGDVGTVGGSAAFLANVSPLWGFLGIAVLASGTMELFGVERRRGRDVATGVVLGAALGLSALLLYFDTTSTSTSGAAVTILFGSLFTVSSGLLPALAGLGGGVLGAVLVMYRPLLLSSVSSELAAARGLPVRFLGVAFLVMTGIGVSLSALAVGTILSTALLIGPAAAALRLTRRPGRAMLAAGASGLAATWLGILLAYDSFYWPPARKGWPVSFFVVALVLVFYVGSGSLSSARSRRARGTT
ncbi:MAG: metal ABC transporter permease [Actinomycetota bacterium]|nr:metal ABC transporter permease [Actinomycetota bacterium]